MPTSSELKSCTDLASEKAFYDKHTNFAGRTLSEYEISPGTRCKFDTILDRLANRPFQRALDVGCSGNSFIHFLPNVAHRVFCDLAQLPLVQYSQFTRYHPTMGSITQMPFSDNSFDLITALDVLEHIDDDQTAASELVRVLKPKGLIVITVPHRMAYFTEQDRICGHVRRYEYHEIQQMFKSRGLQELMKFPVYGQFMKVQFVQQANPEKTEESLNNLREKYNTDPIFKRLWSKFVKIGAKFMRMDARFQPFNKTMDICVIFRKKS
jgi:ubiquinone/menaquinone biosynthesis C-methylase UbiE